MGSNNPIAYKNRIIEERCADVERLRDALTEAHEFLKWVRDEYDPDGCRALVRSIEKALKATPPVAD